MQFKFLVTLLLLLVMHSCRKYDFYNTGNTETCMIIQYDISAPGFYTVMRND